MECGDCGNSEDGLLAYVKGEEEPSRAADIRAHLEGCAACRDEERRARATLELAAKARLDRFELPAGLRARVLAAAAAEAPAPVAAPVPAPAQAPARPAAGRPALAWAAAAAAVLLAAVLFATVSSRRPPEPAPPAARLSWLRGEAARSGPAGTRLAAGSAVPAGEEILVRGTARLDTPAGVRVAVLDGAIALDAGLARLGSGEAAFEVRPGTPFAVWTPDARAEVLGTRFRVKAGPGGTRVDVESGRVALVSAGGRLELGPGESARAAAGAAPARVPAAGPAPWARVLSPESLYLELHAPDPARPGLVEFRLSNVGDRELLLPRVHPDHPWFSLRVRSGSPAGEGLVNLAPFLVPAPDGGAARRAAVALAPGETWSEAFDVTALLPAAGPAELTGVYQSRRSAGDGCWTGTAESQKLERAPRG
ncbi:MAG: FecR domain-containing protein [Planctomycetes bacterium]|nr:FecR domain-containing protein [Planctomycetota bacterium]